MVYQLDVGGQDFNSVTRPAEGLDTLATLQRQFGQKQRFSRDREIYAEGSPSKYWYQVISGTVRLVTLLADGRRHVGGFYLAGDCFGFDLGGARTFAAEAVEDSFVHRYPRQSIGRLIADFPHVARQLWNFTLQDLARTQTQTTILGRMTAPMRVAALVFRKSFESSTPIASALA